MLKEIWRLFEDLSEIQSKDTANVRKILSYLWLIIFAGWSLLGLLFFNLFLLGLSLILIFSRFIKNLVLSLPFEKLKASNFSTLPNRLNFAKIRENNNDEVKNMSKMLVFGHQNPDTDAIASAYGFAYLANEAYSLNTEAVALGTPNEETAFALDYFGVTAPRVVTSAKAEGAEQVILTDHNEFQQSISDIKEVEVYGVVDHHRVANFETANPLYMRLEPVGSASSIVYRLFKESNLEVPKEIAGLLLSGLISDTLLLKSPTTHESDHAVASELAELAGVNLEEYGLALLKAGTNLASKSAEELIDIDAKTFELNGNAVRVAQVNTVDIAEVLERQAEIEAAIQVTNAENGYTDFVLMITDIVNSNSEILALGSNMDKVEAAFNFKLENNHAFLAGAVSRKKQVVPQLTESFNA